MRKPDYDRRVVVTGLGVISPVGNDVKTAWSNLVDGVSGLVPLTRFDTTPYDAKLGGEVHDFVASDWMDAKAARRGESTMAYAVAASKQAVADSGFEITDENRTEVGVVFGSGAGGQSLMIESINNLRDKGPRSVAPTFIANALTDSASGMIAIETGAIGHNVCIVSACAPLAPTTSARPPKRSGAATASRSSADRPNRRSSRWAMPASRTCVAWACPDRASPVRPSRGRST